MDVTAKIITQFVKDLSFENPKGPSSFQNKNERPAINAQVDVKAANQKSAADVEPSKVSSPRRSTHSIRCASQECEHAARTAHPFERVQGDKKLSHYCCDSCAYSTHKLSPTYHHKWCERRDQSI